MKISFLVTYYNQKKYVRQSIDSILAIEKPCDWEILVGDDGSNDGTTDVVKEYIAQYPENISLYIMDREPEKKYEIVRRSSANRLNLIDHMTGDFFCTLDGDDHYCHTGFVVQALKVFEENPQVSVVSFGYQKFTDKGNVLSEHALTAGLLDTAFYLESGLYTCAGACVYRNYMSQERKDFLHKLAYYDDNDIVINNLVYGPMYACSPIVYAYRQTENSTYNAMDWAEKIILNVQGYDVERQIIQGYDDALEKRYYYCLLWGYFLRKKLKRLLGEDKWQRYLQGCAKIPDSLTYRLLHCAEDPKYEASKLHKESLQLFKHRPKAALLVFFKCFLY